MDSYSKYRTMEEARPATEAYKKAHAASMHRSALAPDIWRHIDWA